jgi:predicted RNA-binding protein with PIN domain
VRARRQTEYREARLSGAFHPYDKGFSVKTVREDTISSIIIDGYNLIGIHHVNIDRERDRLIDHLIKYAKAKGHAVTVVFDGWKGGGGTESVSTRGGVRIIYSRLGDKADSVIKRIVSSDRREWIVISSDRDIAAHAWAKGSVPVPSERFLPFVEAAGSDRRARPDVADQEEYEDEEESPGFRKGNPHTLSRKERAVKRVMEKL